MEGLLPEIIAQLNEMGFPTEVYQDRAPDAAEFTMTYIANWAWDMAMYLTYFKLSLYQDSKLIGNVEYNAKSGGLNMNKFGRTADKIRPLLEELLAGVERKRGVGVLTPRG